MTLSAAITQLQALALTCTGVKYAPTSPPDNIEVFPFAVAYPQNGTVRVESFNQRRGLHTIIVEFHVSRVILKTAVAAALAYIEEYSDKLVGDVKLADSVDTILFGEDGGVTYEFGRLAWADVDTIGVRFHVPVKIRSYVTT